MDEWSTLLHDGVQKYAKELRCGESGSPLVTPSEDDEDEYSCVACLAQDEFMSQIVHKISEE